MDAGAASFFHLREASEILRFEVTTGQVYDARHHSLGSCLACRAANSSRGFDACARPNATCAACCKLVPTAAVFIACLLPLLMVKLSVRFVRSALLCIRLNIPVGGAIRCHRCTGVTFTLWMRPTMFAGSSFVRHRCSTRTSPMSPLKKSTASGAAY